MTARGYQKNFSAINSSVLDKVDRERKARKIEYVLKKHASFPLQECVLLDVGSSAGLIAAHLSSFFKQVIGIDYDSLAVFSRESQTIRDRVFMIHGDGLFLPFKDESIDIVVCTQVYEHVPNDKLLFLEIHRVLRRQGIVFFSGPNWLFPIEPHYHIPMLHWLPESLANLCLKAIGVNGHYYERSRHFWSLKRALADFEIKDAFPDVLAWKVSNVPLLRSLATKAPSFLLSLLTPLLPNFNWILRKR